jgi:DegV family protein with EDD domain
MAVAIITDSASGIPASDGHGIGVVPLHLIEDGVSRPESAVESSAIHARLVDGPLAITTSQPSPADFARAFEAAGTDVVAVLISSEMSSTFEAARLGLGIAREHGFAHRVELVDSRSNSMQEGFAVQAAAACAAAGGDTAACRDAALGSVCRSRFLFAPARLDDLVQGGRIAAAVGLVGSALRVVPILTAKNGVTGVAAVARSSARAISRMVELMRRDVEAAGLARIVVAWIGDDSEAQRVATNIVAPIAGTDVRVQPVPACIAVHVGPAIGLAYETIEPLR